MIKTLFLFAIIVVGFYFLSPDSAKPIVAAEPVLAQRPVAAPVKGVGPGATLDGPATGEKKTQIVIITAASSLSV